MKRRKPSSLTLLLLCSRTELRTYVLPILRVKAVQEVSRLIYTTQVFDENYPERFLPLPLNVTDGPERSIQAKGV